MERLLCWTEGTELERRTELLGVRGRESRCVQIERVEIVGS